MTIDMDNDRIPSVWRLEFENAELRAHIQELEAALDSAHATIGENIWRFWRDKAKEAVGKLIAATDVRDQAIARAEQAETALQFYADPANWRDTPPWDGDPDCISPKAIPGIASEDIWYCDCGDTARRALKGGDDSRRSNVIPALDAALRALKGG